MKPRTLLVLAVLVAGLGAFIWFVDRDLPSSEERAELGKKLFPDFETDEVTAVEIERRVEPAAGDGQAAGGDRGGEQGRVERLRMEREPAPAGATAEEDDEGAGDEDDLLEPAASRQWRIVEPAAYAAARADAAAVDRLLDAVARLETVRTVEGAEPGATGLAEPRARLKLVTPEGETEVAIGAEVPASSSVLVSVTGRPDPIVVDGAIVRELDREPGEWRDRRMVDARPAEVERLTLTVAGGAEPVVLARRGERFWLESPVVDRAAADRVDRLLGELTGLAASRFVDAPAVTPAEMGLEPPEAAVEARLAGGGTLAVEVGRPVAEGSSARWARVSRRTATGATGGPGEGGGGQLIETQSPLAESLGTPAADWQSPELSGLELYRIDAVSATRDGETVRLERSGTDWKRGGEVRISYTPVSELLYALTDARAERLVRRDEARRQGARLDRPTLEVTLETDRGEQDAPPPETLALYPPAAGLGGLVPATAGGRDFVLLLPAETAEAIGEQLTRVEQAEPLAAEPEPGSDSGDESGDPESAAADEGAAAAAGS